jgi:hypothetical protein
MMLQIHESIRHRLERDRILGDERNFRRIELREVGAIWQLSIRPTRAERHVRSGPSGEAGAYAIDDGAAARKR